MTGGPPDFDFDRLKIRAKIDFVTIVTEAKLGQAFAGGQQAQWVPNKGVSTLHDPTEDDLYNLSKTVPMAALMEYELAVDFFSVDGLSAYDRETVLRRTFAAIAGRYRPEDVALYGYRRRGGVKSRGVAPVPFHDRFPDAEEQLLWGGRGDWMQAKVYLKRTDNNKELPIEAHCVRIELAVRRGALLEMGVVSVGDMLTQNYRKTFCKHFRMIHGVRERLRRERPATAALKRRIARGWARAGVGAFALGKGLPVEAGKLTEAAVRNRARRQVPVDMVKLDRHVKANARIGNALQQLDRRMSARVSSGAMAPGAASLIGD